MGLYWRARQEVLAVCAGRALETLRALQSLGYERYYFRGRSRRDALAREFQVTEKNVLATLARGVNRTDIPRVPIPELGWGMSLWSGDADDESYSINIRCGGYSEHVGNSVVLILPATGACSICASPDRALRAYDVLIGIWEPEQAVLCEGSISWDEGRIVPSREPLAQMQRRDG